MISLSIHISLIKPIQKGSHEGYLSLLTKLQYIVFALFSDLRISGVEKAQGQGTRGASSTASLSDDEIGLFQPPEVATRATFLLWYL